MEFELCTHVHVRRETERTPAFPLQSNPPGKRRVPPQRTPLMLYSHRRSTPGLAMSSLLLLSLVFGVACGPDAGMAYSDELMADSGAGEVRADSGVGTHGNGNPRRDGDHKSTG